MSGSQATKAQLGTLEECKMPGYTGFIPGMQETYKKTPVLAQVEVKEPSPDSFLYSRTIASPKGPPAKDVQTHKPEPDVLWPSLQASAVQGSLKPPPNTMALGDMRIDVFRTSYNSDFKAPFSDHERLRSPNRNEDLAKTTASLRDIYASAFNRVGDKRLQKIISTMRERLEAKMGNQNNNAFKFRKLFWMYDTQKTGRVHYEDFRNMAEQFGMQLDDDSLLALFYVYDPEGTGYLVYHDLAKHLMDKDCYALYINTLDMSQEAVDDEAMLASLTQLAAKFAPMAGDLERVLKAFDSEGTGLLPPKELAGGCAGLGLVITDKEVSMMSHFSLPDGSPLVDEAGLVSISNFIAMLTSGPASVLTSKRTRARSTMSPLTSPTSPAPKRTAF